VTRAAIALIALVAVAGLARADDADRAFRDAAARATAGDPGAVDAFEALGAARPVTAWTDDAWSEAARLAERAGQLDRARRDLEQVIALGTDPQLVRRARGALARLAANTGAGAWDAVAAEHERLVAQLAAGDPEPVLEQLEALVRANPRYPRANLVRLAIASGWERDDNRGRALAWYEEAAALEPGRHAWLEWLRALVRAGQLARAEHEIARLEHAPETDRASLAEVRRALDRAVLRAWIRRGLWGVLAVLAVLAAFVLRRDAGSWRSAARRLARPPLEVLFLVPIAAVLVAVAHTGNPLVAAAVRTIAIAGVLVAWISGAMLDAVAAPRARRVLLQAGLAVIAVVAATYLAVDHDRMIELVLETWHEGPATR